MPSYVQCLSLLKLCSRQICEQIVNLTLRRTRNCKSIVGLAKGHLKGEWKMFLEMKTLYNLPDNFKMDVFQECRKLWWSNGNSELLSSGEEIYCGDFLILYFFYFHDENCLWDTTVVENNGNITFDSVSLFNPKVSLMTVPPYSDEELLKTTLCNVRYVLTIVCTFTCDDQYLRIIGKHCDKLRNLRIQITPDFVVTSKGALEFCYEDYPGNSIKNKVCDTLVVLHGLCTYKGYSILIQNIPNVQRLMREDYVPFIYPTTPITKAVASTYHSIRYRPGEEFNSLSDDETNFMFKQDKPIHELMIEDCINPDRPILVPNAKTRQLILNINYFSLEDFQLPPTWPNLQGLVITVEDIYRCVVDVYSIAEACPNLIFLSLTNCVEKQRRKFIPFRNLEKLFLDRVELPEGCNILSETSHRLKSLWYRHYESGILSFDKTVAYGHLVSQKYPLLESLKYSPAIKGSKKNILNFLKEFPNLKTFGYVTDTRLYGALEKEILLRNWDLKIVTYFEHVTIKDAK